MWTLMVCRGEERVDPKSQTLCLLVYIRNSSSRDSQWSCCSATSRRANWCGLSIFVWMHMLETPTEVLWTLDSGSRDYFSWLALGDPGVLCLVGLLWMERWMTFDEKWKYKWMNEPHVYMCTKTKILIWPAWDCSKGPVETGQTPWFPGLALLICWKDFYQYEAGKQVTACLKCGCNESTLYWFCALL